MVWYPSTVEAAFGADRAADPATIPAAAWIDISADVAKWNTSRGRSIQLADIQTGTGSLELHNDNAQYSPGYNPAALNLLDTARQSGGSSLAGVLPDNMILSSGLTNVALSCQATVDPDFQHPFAFAITVTAGATGTPALYTGAAGDSQAGPFTISECIRVDPSSSYRFSFQHELRSGTGTSVSAQIHWLDSDGTILSTDSSANFTPTGTVTQRNLSGTSHASARYAALKIQYSGVPGAAHVYHFTALQFLAGTSTTLLDPVHYPNIRPGVPVRITMENSSAASVDMFYGFTGEWVENIDDSTVTVDLNDAFELLAEIELKSAADEQTTLVAPLISIPLDDESETRQNFKVITSTGDKLTRSVPGTTNARDLSEWTFGEPGPQDGKKSVYVDPQSATIGYCLKVQTNVATRPVPSAGDPTFCYWGWFKVRRREHEGRAHNITHINRRLSSDLVARLSRVWMTDTGTIQAEVLQEASTVVFLTAIETTETYHDGEWHFFYVEHVENGASDYDLNLYVDKYGADGELVTDNAATTWDYTDTPLDISIGGRIDDDRIGSSMARASLSSVGFKHGVLTTTERESLYATTAPPSIFVGETEDTRIGRLLDFTAWPAAQRSLDAGLTTLVGPHPSGTNLLDALKQTAESAGGVIYVDKSGKIAYANRQRRYNPATTLTCAVASTNMPESDIIPTIDNAQVYNRVRVARATGDAIEANNLESQARYGIRTLDLDMSVLDDEDAAQAANWFLHVYSEPVARVDTVLFNAGASSADTLWDWLADLELLQAEVIDLGVSRLGGALFMVEKIDLSYDAEQKLFTGSLQLSPGTAYTNICTLNDATDGVLDSCVLGW